MGLHNKLVTACIEFFDWFDHHACPEEHEHSDEIQSLLKQIEGLHQSGCALYNAPAYPPGPCDCGVITRSPEEMERVRKQNSRDREAFDKAHKEK